MALLKKGPISLETPIDEKTIRSLKAGDLVEISGIIYTGRDAVHKKLYEGKKCPVKLGGQIIYHCGPVVVETKTGWQVTAAGPTTSIREEPYQAKLIEQLGLRAIIGKGGMGPKTLAALKKFGAVYLHAVGGAAQFLCEKIVSVKNVYWLKELGAPEAIWELEVKNFPVMVTMDSHGVSLHQTILENAQKEYQRLVS